VDEVDPGAVHLGDELVEGVQSPLGAAPVVGVAPVREQLGEVAALGAVVPAGIGELLREPNVGRSDTRKGAVESMCAKAT